MSRYDFQKKNSGSLPELFISQLKTRDSVDLTEVSNKKDEDILTRSQPNETLRILASRSNLPSLNISPLHAYSATKEKSPRKRSSSLTNSLPQTPVVPALEQIPSQRSEVGSIPPSTRFDFLHEVEKLLQALGYSLPRGNHESNGPPPILPSKCKVLVVGPEIATFAQQLKKLNIVKGNAFTIPLSVVFAATTRDAVAALVKDQEIGIAVVSYLLSDGTSLDAMSKLVQLGIPFVGNSLDDLILVLTNGRPSAQDRQRCIDHGAFECFSLLSPVESLISHVRSLWENTWLRRQLKSLLTKEREKLVLAYDVDSHLYNKERFLELESHAKILEDYKREAESMILFMEEENLKLKSESIQLKEEAERVKQLNVAGKWRIATLNQKQKKTAAKDAQRKRIGMQALQEEDSEDFTPIQNITRTVGRLTKVSELLDAADLKNVLSGVMSNLSSTNLYSPSPHMLDQLELDEMTKKYIVSSFTDLHDHPEENVPHRPLERSNSEKVVPEVKGLDKSKEHMLTEFVSPVWSFSSTEIEILITLMFDNLGLINEFDIPMETLSSFIVTLRSNYLDNPYHNFSHAYDVTQMCYIMVTQSKANIFLSKLDQLSIIVGALCHDVCHPGTNNAFQVNAQTELAMTYNDQSVLENLHCSKTFSILKDEKNNILGNLLPAQFKEVRKSIIQAILATDMTVHFELTSKFSTSVEAKISSPGEETMFSKDPKDKQLLINIILHSADISNMVRPTEISRKWSDLVFEEFLAQVNNSKSLHQGRYGEGTRIACFAFL